MRVNVREVVVGYGIEYEVNKKICIIHVHVYSMISNITIINKMLTV